MTKRTEDLSINQLEIKKFRCLYKYSFDDEYLYFYWKKGKKIVEDKYLLKELSSLLGYWKGYAKSTKKNFIISLFAILVGIAVYLFATDAWMLFITLMCFVVTIEILFDEIGFFFPLEATVLNFSDGSDCLYMQRDRSNESDRIDFEVGLKEAIENSKSE